MVVSLELCWAFKCEWIGAYEGGSVGRAKRKNVRFARYFQLVPE